MPKQKPFREALAQQDNKVLFPTSLGSAELGQIDAALLRQAVLSARNGYAEYLQKIRDVTRSIINPETIERDGQLVTVGMDQATARLELKRMAQKLGITPSEEDRGTLRDHTSLARRSLVVKTNVETVQGAGHFIQSNDPDVIDAFPCWELVRFESREKERDWPQRFMMAAESVGDEDAIRVLNEHKRMVARKDSPIWQALGSRELFDDALGNPYPPFAFGTGMWTQDVSREDSEALGIPVENVQAQKLDGLVDLPPVSDAVRDADLVTLVTEGVDEGPGETIPTVMNRLRDSLLLFQRGLMRQGESPIADRQWPIAKRRGENVVVSDFS